MSQLVPHQTRFIDLHPLGTFPARRLSLLESLVAFSALHVLSLSSLLLQARLPHLLSKHLKIIFCLSPTSPILWTPPSCTSIKLNEEKVKGAAEETSVGGLGGHPAAPCVPHRGLWMCPYRTSSLGEFFLSPGLNLPKSFRGEITICDLTAVLGEIFSSWGSAVRNEASWVFCPVDQEK